MCHAVRGLCPGVCHTDWASKPSAAAPACPTCGSLNLAQPCLAGFFCPLRLGSAEPSLARRAGSHPHSPHQARLCHTQQGVKYQRGTSLQAMQRTKKTEMSPNLNWRAPFFCQATRLPNQLGPCFTAGPRGCRTKRRHGHEREPQRTSLLWHLLSAAWAAPSRCVPQCAARARPAGMGKELSPCCSPKWNPWWGFQGRASGAARCQSCSPAAGCTAGSWRDAAFPSLWPHLVMLSVISDTRTFISGYNGVRGKNTHVYQKADYSGKLWSSLL